MAARFSVDDFLSAGREVKELFENLRESRKEHVEYHSMVTSLEECDLEAPEEVTQKLLEIELREKSILERMETLFVAQPLHSTFEKRDATVSRSGPLWSYSYR